MNVKEELFFTIAVFWGLSAIIAMIVAVIAIRARRETVHRRLMLVLVLGGWAFTAYYLLGYRDESVGRLYHTDLFKLWLRVHGTIAFFTLLSATSLIWARYVGQRPGPVYSLRNILNSRHKTIGRVTAFFWVVTHLNGLLNVFFY